MSTLTYTAFGLTVDSDLPLPQLDPVPAEGDPDVTVRCGAVPLPADAEPFAGETVHHYVAPDEFYVSYGVADTAVLNGNEILVAPREGAPMDIVTRLVVGPLLNYLLHQRGYLVVHASTVQVGDRAVAFAGDSGQGKSTTASAFLAAGHRLLSDDVAAVRLADGVPMAQPGYPAVKLDPDAMTTLNRDLESGLAETVAAPRLFYRLGSELAPAPVPLARVYLLEDGHELEFVPLPGGERCMALVENTYTRGAFGLSGASTANLKQCATVANAVPVKRLRRPRRFDVLPDLVDAVCADVEADE